MAAAADDASLEKPAPAPEHERHTMSTTRAALLIFSVTFGMMTNTANSTASSIALPRIGEALHIQENQLQWIVSAYTLSSGCLLIFFGRLADLYGRKRAFILGNIVSAVLSLGCGFAKDSLTIDVLRGLQGAGSAASIPASLGILAHAFPPSRMRSLAFATFSAGAPVGASFGMTIGAVLTQLTTPGWRSQFYFIAAMGAVAIITGIFSIDADAPLRQKNLSAADAMERRIDWLGAFLVTAGLVFIVFVLSDGEIASNGWKTGYIIALLIVGVLLVAVFLYWQTVLDKLQQRAIDGHEVPWWAAPPLVRPGLWTRAKGKLAAMMAVAFLNWCCFLAWTFWVQLYYQQYLGLTPILTMVRLLPMFVAGVLVNVIVALVVGRVNVVILITIGTLCTACATLLFALIKTGASYWAFGFPAAVLSVCGADFVFSTGTLFVAKVALPGEQSLAGALFLTMTQLGTSFGLTVSTIVFDRVVQRHPGNGGLAGYRAAQWTAFGFGLFACAITVLFLRGVGVVGHPKNPKSPPQDTEGGNARTGHHDTPSDDTETIAETAAAAGTGGALAPPAHTADTETASG